MQLMLSCCSYGLSIARRCFVSCSFLATFPSLVCCSAGFLGLVCCCCRCAFGILAAFDGCVRLQQRLLLRLLLLQLQQRLLLKLPVGQQLLPQPWQRPQPLQLQPPSGHCWNLSLSSNVKQDLANCCCRATWHGSNQS